MVGISPIESHIDAPSVAVIGVADLSALLHAHIGVLVSAQPLFLEHNLQGIHLHKMRKDDALLVDAYVGMLDVVSLEHLQEQHAALGPNLPQLRNLASPLLCVGVYGALQNYDHLVLELGL